MLCNLNTVKSLLSGTLSNSILALMHKENQLISMHGNLSPLSDSAAFLHPGFHITNLLSNAPIYKYLLLLYLCLSVNFIFHDNDVCSMSALALMVCQIITSLLVKCI